MTALLSQCEVFFLRDDSRHRNERVWCKLLEKPPMQPLAGKKNLPFFPFRISGAPALLRTVARMKISCRGRAAAFLRADLSLHLPDKRYVNKQTDRKRRGDKVSELNERQAQMKCDARKKRCGLVRVKKFSTPKEQVAVS